MQTPKKTTRTEPDQLKALPLFFFKLYEQATVIVQIFWGLWLIPFGLLVHKSVFIPRILGILLVLGGLGYAIANAIALLFPRYSGVVGRIVTIPSMIGEFGIIFLLRTRGVRSTPPQSQN